MTQLAAPRFEVPIDEKGNRVSREWYKYLVKLGTAQNSSPTSSDDFQSVQNLDAASNDALTLSAIALAQAASASAANANSLVLLSLTEDQPKQPDDLMAWWPG